MYEKVALISLGCSKNLVDSEVMIKLISEGNYYLTDDVNASDIIIINTCGFIESAKQESIDTIIEMGKLKETANCKVLIATGCLSERYKEELLRELPELDAVIGTGDYKDILDVIEKSTQGQKVVRFGNQENVDIAALPRTISTLGAAAYLKIAEGCDNRCSYCIIPKLRGRYRSRTIEDITSEAKWMAQNGIKELNIIAQDTTRYGIDLYGEYRINQLLKELTRIEGVQWIRLLYSYPDEFSDELIETIASEEKICKYLDIPVQHASNKVLKKMARRTSREQILNLIDKLRHRILGVSIRTSLIVGFPGETDADFNELYEFVKSVRFDRLGVFAYSKEEDTPAYDFSDHIDEEIKLERRDSIMLLQQGISLENNKRMVGRTLKVYIETIDNGNYVGRCYKDAPEIDGNVYFTSSKKLLPGEFCSVMIQQANEYDLLGEYTNEHSK